MKLTLEQHEFIALKAIIDDRLNTLQKNIVKKDGLIQKCQKHNVLTIYIIVV